LQRISSKRSSQTYSITFFTHIAKKLFLFKQMSRAITKNYQFFVWKFPDDIDYVTCKVLYKWLFWKHFLTKQINTLRSYISNLCFEFPYTFYLYSESNILKMPSVFKILFKKVPTVCSAIQGHIAEIIVFIVLQHYSKNNSQQMKIIKTFSLKAMV